MTAAIQKNVNLQEINEGDLKKYSKIEFLGQEKKAMMIEKY